MNNPDIHDSSIDRSTAAPHTEKKEGLLESLGAAIAEVVTGSVPDESLAEAGHDKRPAESTGTPAATPVVRR